MKIESSAVIADITTEDLVTFGAEALAAILMDCADKDSDLRDRLRLSVAARRGQDALDALTASLIQALVDDRCFYDWEMAGTLAARIDTLRIAIADGFEDSRMATKHLANLVATSDSVMNQVDDSSGRVGGAYGDAITAWGTAWSQIPDRDAGDIAALVLLEIQTDAYGVKDDVLLAFTEALGSAGLIILRSLIQQELAKSPSDNWQWLRELQRVADGLGDVDGFIAAIEIAENSVRQAVDVASRLVAVCRHAEALCWLDKADTTTRQAADVRIAALLGLGRDHEASEVRWTEATGFLRIEHFRIYAEALPPDERNAANEAAIAAAMAHRNVHGAIGFLLDLPDAAAAERLIITRHRDLDGRQYPTLLAMAKALADDHPLAALLLYRVLAEAILDGGRSPAYHHAADYVCIADRLSTRIEDWQGQETQGGFIARLHEVHRRKRAFWPEMERAERTHGQGRL